MNVSNKDKKNASGEWAKHPRKRGKKTGNKSLRKKLKADVKKEKE